MQLAVTLTLLAAVMALWIRRHTWRMRWEAAATLNVALQSLNVVLLCPRVSRWISPKLHAITGQWNIEDLIGHLAYMGGLAAVLYMAVSRLNMTDRQLRRFVKHRIELPATIFVPLAVGTFVYGRFGRHYVPDLVLLDQAAWLRCYYLLYIAAIAYFLGQAAWVLLILRQDPNQVRAANFYLAAIGVSALCCCAFIVDFDPKINWLLIRAEVAAYALAASYSWRSKVRYLRGDDRPRVPQ